MTIDDMRNTPPRGRSSRGDPRDTELIRSASVAPPRRVGVDRSLAMEARAPMTSAVGHIGQNKGNGMMIFMMLLIGAALCVVPWLAPASVLSPVAATALTVIGALMLMAVAVLSIITKMYRKASANLAFVRTGMGGAWPIMDGGALVFPVVHQVIPVSLETMRLNVERRGPHALITKDNLRVDLSAEFYIKVQAHKEDIVQAARSLGGRNVQPDAVSDLVQEKLVSALRTVAATKELVELHSKRDEFATAVQQIVMHDLASNGLTLESVTISSLDQTDPGQLQEQNVFDAQGLRKIAEITQKARIERNEIEREAEQQVVAKNVQTKKQVLEMERDQSQAEAEQKMKIATMQAGRERETAEFKLAQDQAVATRDIEKRRAVETAEVQRRLTVEQAEIEKITTLIAKQKEQQTAEITRKQTVEVAERSREVAVADKERELASAKAAMLTAEAERTAADQNILTVQVTSEAQREAEKKLIAAKQEITQNKIREETNADVLAYMRLKEADAEKQAAEMQFQAKVRLAEADATGQARKAEGERAIKMVDVNVEREKVNVEQARVEVERVSLSNRQEYGDAALKFELEKLRIEADKEVRIAAAQAMANMFAKAQMQIFGDPTTMSQMSQQFLKAASYGTATDGFVKALPPEAKDLLEQIGQQVATHLGKGNGKVKAVESVDVTGKAAAPVEAESADVKHRG
jgi:flotillin